MADPFDLFGADSSPEGRAQALASILRKKQAAGALGMLSGDRVLGRYGEQSMRGADELALQRAELQRQGQELQAQRTAAYERSLDTAAEGRGKSLEMRERELAGREQDRALKRALAASGAKSKAARAEAAAAKKDAQGAFDDASDLRKEFNQLPEVKSFKEVDVSFAKIKNALEPGEGKTASAADDLAAIFSFMKMLDPGSSVREGEFANAQNAAGVPDRVRNAWNNAQAGTRLSEAQRREFLQAAQSFYGAHKQRRDETAARMRDIAKRKGLKEDDVAPMDAPAKAAGGKPKAPKGLTPEEEALLREAGVIE